MKERSGMPYDVVAYEADERARCLSPCEEGLFHRLLRLAWMNGSIPNDLGELAALCRVRPTTMQKAWPKLSPMWASSSVDSRRLVNDKQEKERIFIELKRSACAIAGKESANVRQIKKEALTDVERSVNLPSHPIPVPSQPNSNRNGERENKDNTPSAFSVDTFNRVWELYPQKDGRAAALKHFTRTVKTVSDLESCMTALNNYKAHLRLHPDKPIKNGSTWFNNWQDWYEWVEPVRAVAPRKETRDEFIARTNRETAEIVNRGLSDPTFNGDWTEYQSRPSGLIRPSLSGPPDEPS